MDPPPDSRRADGNEPLGSERSPDVQTPMDCQVAGTPLFGTKSQGIAAASWRPKVLRLPPVNPCHSQPWQAPRQPPADERPWSPNRLPAGWPGLTDIGWRRPRGVGGGDFGIVAAVLRVAEASNRHHTWIWRRKTARQRAVICRETPFLATVDIVTPAGLCFAVNDTSPAGWSGDDITLVLSAGSGALSTPDDWDGMTSYMSQITIQGNLSQVNSDLAQTSYLSNQPGSDTITVSGWDNHGGILVPTVIPVTIENPQNGYPNS